MMKGIYIHVGMEWGIGCNLRLAIYLLLLQLAVVTK